MFLIPSGAQSQFNNYSQRDRMIEVSRPLDRYFYKCNCTIKERHYLDTGSPDENGTYDGFIGMIQRDEADATFMAIRSDFLAFEPGKPTPPVQSSDIAIFSAKQYVEKLEERDLMSFLSLCVPIDNLLFHCPNGSCILSIK